MCCLWVWIIQVDYLSEICSWYYIVRFGHAYSGEWRLVQLILWIGSGSVVLMFLWSVAQDGDLDVVEVPVDCGTVSDDVAVVVVVEQ